MSKTKSFFWGWYWQTENRQVVKIKAQDREMKTPMVQVGSYGFICIGSIKMLPSRKSMNWINQAMKKLNEWNTYITVLLKKVVTAPFNKIREMCSPGGVGIKRFNFQKYKNFLSQQGIDFFWKGHRKMNSYQTKIR